MNQPTLEQLSSLMDGELARDEARFLLKRMAGEPDLAVRWSRYHVIRQTLRRQEVLPLRVDFADGVMARLAEEIPVARARPALWLRVGTGGAIAASVAVAALMLTQPARTPTGGVQQPALARASAPVVPINVAPVAATTSSPAADFRAPLLVPNAPVDAAPVSFGTDLGQPIATDPRLQSYLIRHYQAAGSSGQSGFVPYVLLGAPARDAAGQPVQPEPQNR
jgi:sigma-E factor negative regulatory protein RseA